MNFSLKSKLFIGFGFLFLMIILIWIIGGFFIYDLSNRSAAMLKENYQSVESTKFLLQSLNEIKDQQNKYLHNGKDIYNDSAYSNNIQLFQKNLKDVQNNITESGEGLLINDITKSFNLYLSEFESIRNNSAPSYELFLQELIPAFNKTNSLIIDLWDMNMSAISYKNSLLKNTAHRAFVIISLIGTICFIISALVFFKYPQNISKPIIQLTQGIREIANRNYEQRIIIQSSDEFGKLAEAFNTMAAKLNEYEHSSLSELLFEKKRIDTIINNMKDAIIGLDNKKVVIFSNSVACELMHIHPDDIIGKYAPDLAAEHELFHLIIKDVAFEEGKQNKEFNSFKYTVNNIPVYFSKEILDVNITRTGENQTLNVGKVIILKNITKFLEQDEAKTNFIATISHELKTPLSSLRLNLKLLNDERIGNLNEEQKNILEALKQETSKMLKITSEILDLAQVETGNIKLNLKNTSPVKIIENSKETAESYAKTKNIILN